MIVKEITIYKCEYCGKIYQRKHFCVSHEPKCRKNPKNYQPCLDGCVHITKKEAVFYCQTLHAEYEHNCELLFCNAKNEYIYPYWVNGYDEADIDDGETPNNPMPQSCENYKIF